MLTRSRQEIAPLNCPSCGTAFEATVWLVVDRVERPDLVHLLLDGELNVQRCPQCGAEGGINHPLLYHDPAKPQVICAVPLTVQSGAATREMVGELLTGLVAQIDPADRRPYLGAVELVPELDGLRALLIEQALADDAQISDRLVALAVSELLNVRDQHEFQRIVAEHRKLLLGDAAEAVLDELKQGALKSDDRELLRRIKEAKAVLGRLRSTLHSRQTALAALLDELAPLNDAEVAVVPALQAMLVAVDPQEVYAARIALEPDQRPALDGLLGRLSEQAAAQHETGVLPFLRTLQELPTQ